MQVERFVTMTPLTLNTLLFAILLIMIIQLNMLFLLKFSTWVIGGAHRHEQDYCYFNYTFKCVKGWLSIVGKWYSC